MHGEFLKSVLEKENVETEGMLLDEKYFTTLAFVNIDENGERTFSFAKKTRSRYQNGKRRNRC